MSDWFRVRIPAGPLKGCSKRWPCSGLLTRPNAGSIPVAPTYGSVVLTVTFAPGTGEFRVRFPAEPYRRPVVRFHPPRLHGLGCSSEVERRVLLHIRDNPPLVRPVTEFESQVKLQSCSFRPKVETLAPGRLGRPLFRKERRRIRFSHSAYA